MKFKPELEIKEVDFLIIGTGIAGLFTSLKLSKMKKKDIFVLTKDEIKESNTQYAQGGIAAVLDQGDSLQSHIKDTLEAGAGLCNEKAVKILITEGPERVKELIELGTNFDHIEGELDLSKEGAHSKRRILHARGDATGEEIRESLTKVVKEKENIYMQENNFMIDFFTSTFDNKTRIEGVLVWDIKNENYKVYQSHQVILATGGCGQIYQNTSNPEVTTGDGVAAAFRAGANIMDMEFIQFHPTTLYNSGDAPFLISETLRGEGAVLRNSSGERFMPSYHERADLAPRDIVARAIMKEIQKGDYPFVWLDITNKEEEYLENRFPNIFEKLLEQDIDISKDYIPVIPAAHYLMGGVKTDVEGKTNIEGLYACGEAACTGVHGANRLASNSLLEGLVFGHRIYEYIRKRIFINQAYQNIDKTNILKNLPENAEKSLDLDQKRKKLKKKMMVQAGIVRNKSSLKDLKKWIYNIRTEIEDYELENISVWELKNMLTVAEFIVISALKRRESRGAHYRSDFPETKEKWQNQHILINTENPEGKINVLE